MKYRKGFVSNSSSSSFIVELSSLNFFEEEKIKKDIMDVSDYAYDNGWDFSVYRGYIIASTYMDNEDLIQYLVDNYRMNKQNLIQFGSYSGFGHCLNRLKEFIDINLFKETKMNYSQNVNIVKEDNAILPTYATEGSSGMDLFAKDAGVVKAHSKQLIPLGFKVEIPNPFLEFQVRPKSGLALKKGITVLNTPGTIDSDYRGDVGVILINHSDEDYHYERGDKIAQLVLVPVYKCIWHVSNEISDTVRGEGGFGSTGRK